MGSITIEPKTGHKYISSVENCVCCISHTHVTKVVFSRVSLCLMLRIVNSSNMQMRLKALQNAFEEPKEVSQSPGTLFTEEPFCSLFSSC